MESKLQHVMKPAMEKLLHRHPRQEDIIKAANDSAWNLLVNHVNFFALDAETRATLKDAAVRLFVKYYNGRELELLTEPYVTAEVVDLVLERDIEKTVPLVVAIAQFVAAFEKFIAKYDTEESK